MNEIYKKINDKTNGKYADIRFAKAAFKSDAVVTVVCKPSDEAFVVRNKTEIIGLLTEICEFHRAIALDIVSAPPTASILRAEVVAFTQNYGYVSSAAHGISVVMEPSPSIKLKMHRAMYDLAKNDYIPCLKEFLQNSYAQDIAVDIEIVDFSECRTSAATVVGGGKREYDISNARPVIGNLAPDKARSVSSIVESEYNVTVCGIYAMPTAFLSKGGRAYDRFLLYDGDMALQCRFTPFAAERLADIRHINCAVCALGNIEYDAMRNEATLSVREFSLCDVKGLSPLPLRAQPQSYEVVKPQAYEEFVQSSMFERVQKLPASLDGSFVVFDFETTGLSVLHDKPTELGAVKIENGRVTSTFSTLIDPRRPIPPEVAQKTGITDDMVKGQPLFEDVLPDFYKYTYDCSVVCHNIAFDFPFLLCGGNRCGWAFGDRKTYDTMAIAPMVLRGLTKLSLDKILEELGLVNDNAHRACADAMATAKAFIELQKRLAQKQ